MGQHLSDYLKIHTSTTEMKTSKRTKDMSSAEFGRRVGISKSAAAEILAGRSTPEEQTLRKISDAFNLPLSHLRELALLDTPFDLPATAKLLDMKERALVRSVVDQLLESSGKANRFRDESEQERVASNVVRLPQPPRVQKAAYNPPDEE